MESNTLVLSEVFHRQILWHKHKAHRPWVQTEGKNFNSNKVLNLVSRTVKYGLQNQSIIEHKLKYEMLYFQSTEYLG